MLDPAYVPKVLAAVHEAAAADIVPAVPGGRVREAARCLARTLARLRLQADHGVTLESRFLGEWQALATRLGAGSGPGGLREQATRIGDAVRGGAKLSTDDFRAAIAAVRGYHGAVEGLLPAVSARPAEADESQVLRGVLARYLRERFPELPADPIRSLRIIPGGRAKQTALFELVPNAVLPTRLVLRRDLAQSSTGTSVHAEFPLLKKVESLGLPVPSPVLAEADPSKLGGGFIVVTEVQDSEPAGELFAELSNLTRLHASFPAELGRALARLHSLEEHPSGDALGGHAAGVPPVDMVRNFHQLWSGLRSRPPMSAATDLGFAWLLQHPLPADRPRRLVHGDVGLHNMLVREGHLAAILDWELTHLGDPAEDLAYVRTPLIEHLVPWQRFVDGYVAEGGSPEAADPRAVAWYGVWSHARNSVYVSMLYDWTMAGQRGDIESINAGLDFFARLQDYLARDLERALETMP